MNFSVTTGREGSTRCRRSQLPLAVRAVYQSSSLKTWIQRKKQAVAQSGSKLSCLKSGEASRYWRVEGVERHTVVDSTD